MAQPGERTPITQIVKLLMLQAQQRGYLTRAEIQKIFPDRARQEKQVSRILDLLTSQALKS